MVNGTQWAQFYADGVLVYQYPLGQNYTPVQAEAGAGTLTQAIATYPASAPVRSNTDPAPTFFDPSYTATTYGTAPVTTPAPPANAVSAPPNPFIAPGGYAIAPPPPVSARGTYDFLPQGFVWSQFQSAARDVSDPNNPLWARGLLYGLGAAAAPLALFEEGLRDVMNTVSDMGIRAGENMGRASLWWQQGGYGEAAEDALFAIAEDATAFVGAAQLAQPVASAVRGAFPGGLRGMPVAAEGSALGSVDLGPTFGNLGGPQEGKLYGVLQQTDGVYHLQGSTTPLAGKVDFVIQGSKILVGEGHGFLAGGGRVAYAGELHFANDGSGALEFFSNVSGHIRPSAAFVGNAQPFLSAPFRPPSYFPISAGLPQLPVFQPPPGTL